MAPMLSQFDPAASEWGCLACHKFQRMEQATAVALLNYEARMRAGNPPPPTQGA